MKWTYVKDKLPEKDGRYRVTCAHPTGSRTKSVQIRDFANNLYEVNKIHFQFSKRPGWFVYDYEYGYIEEKNVIAWAEMSDE